MLKDFAVVTAAMNQYLATMISARRQTPRDDLLSRLIAAEVDGTSLSQDEILGFFQLLVVGGQETTATLINNTVLSLLENQSQLELLRTNMELLPSAIDETLRHRAPIQ